MVNNILIIGITGNGKSALANTLTKTNEFGESSLGISATKDFQAVEFEWEKDGKKIKYRVIDNIGFGDTNKISEEEILLKVGEGIYSAKEGINQILFVFGGRFGPEHVEAFKKFESFISESGIAKYTTLVRTKFPSFRDPEECKRDQQNLLNEENKDLRETVRSCSFIHIDNPPIPEIDEEDSDNEEEINISNEKRQASREKVLNHLANNCLETYKFGEWNSIYQIINDYINKKEEIGTDKEKLSKLKSEVTGKIKVHLAKELPVAAIEYSMKK